MSAGIAAARKAALPVQAIRCFAVIWCIYRQIADHAFGREAVGRRIPFRGAVRQGCEAWLNQCPLPSDLMVMPPVELALALVAAALAFAAERTMQLLSAHAISKFPAAYRERPAVAERFADCSERGPLLSGLTGQLVRSLWTPGLICLFALLRATDFTIGFAALFGGALGIFWGSIYLARARATEIEFERDTGRPPSSSGPIRASPTGPRIGSSSRVAIRPGSMRPRSPDMG